MLFVDRYIFLRESLRKLIQDTKPDKVGIESPVFHDLYSEGMYGLFLYCCEALKTEGLDVVFFSPMQVKSFAREYLGRPKGWKMQKPDMVAAAKKHSCTQGAWNHNEADAYLIACLAARFWQLWEGVIPTETLSTVEAKLFTEVRQYTRGKKEGEIEAKGLMHREDDRFFIWSKKGV
jgi:Holliday junction resolvasome RuvABC endonuclease subunit